MTAQEALQWALDQTDLYETRLKELDLDGWKRLDHTARLAAKAKAHAALATLAQENSK